MPWLAVILGYLMGCIPTAYLAGRLLRGRDIRQMGDGNVGARTAYYELGVITGVIVGIVDAGKGILAVVIAWAVGAHEVAVMFTGVAVVVGHNWPIFLGFRGGRGESTTIGVMLTMVTMPMLVVAGPALLVLFIKKNVKLASAVLFIALPLVCWWMKFPGSLVAYSVGLPCLVGFTHFLRTRRMVRISTPSI